METERLIRRSLRNREYQIEYTPADVVGAGSEYRVRRGRVGSWTPWFKTRNIFRVLSTLGMPTPLTDFAFEALLGRGEIILNKAMITKLSNEAGMNTKSTYLYARAKRVDEDTWVIPAKAVNDRESYVHLKQVIASSL